MQKEFIPFQIERGIEREIWYVDVSSLSTLELIKLKEELKNTTFSIMIPYLDNLIYSSINEFNASSDVYGSGYRKAQKRDKKIKERAKMKKYRRR